MRTLARSLAPPPRTSALARSLPGTAATHLAYQRHSTACSAATASSPSHPEQGADASSSVPASVGRHRLLPTPVDRQGANSLSFRPSLPQYPTTPLPPPPTPRSPPLAANEEEMPPLAPQRRKASPSPPPSEPSSGSGSDSDLHLNDHSDPEDDGFFSARSAAVDEQDSDEDVDDDDEESQDDEEEEGEDDGEMGELEQEYRTLQANQQTILQTLKQHRDDDVARGKAVKNQKELWDKTLEMRFLLQKAFSTSNKLPKDPTKSRFCSHDQEIEQAYVELLDSSKQTLGCMMKLQEALLERNQAAKGPNDKLPDSNGENNDEWLELQKVQTRITPFRNTEIDKWQRKTQVTTGAAALKGKLHAFNQNISDQVAGYMRDPSRMINRMYLRKSDVGVFGESAAEPAVTVEGKTVEGDPELVDDSEFYHQLLKEFLESRDGASESAFYALRKKQNKKRKLVDRRASKSRKIRYNVHEKLANFMAPVPMTVPPMASKLFENLFGMGNQKPTTA